MKKIYFWFVVIFLSSSIFISKISAKENSIPKGLEDKRLLTKITFIHYKKGYGKPAGVGKDKNSTSSCYTYLSNGAKWRVSEPYFINPQNPDNLRKDFVEDTINLSVDEWENYAGQIFGEGQINNEASYNNGDYDTLNTASFGPYPDKNVIAVTTIWGYWYGRPNTREIVEWDMLFNTASTWHWGDAEKNSSLMDLQNIATHELGHSAGMGDLYETTCNMETMYGYSLEGEMIKRNLEKGDIAGITKLY